MSIHSALAQTSEIEVHVNAGQLVDLRQRIYQRNYERHQADQLAISQEWASLLSQG